MKQKQPRHESPDKAGVSDKPPRRHPAETQSAITRFKKLTRRLLTVSKEQLQAAEQERKIKR
jgi:hypothetical protein